MPRRSLVVTAALVVSVFAVPLLGQAPAEQKKPDADAKQTGCVSETDPASPRRTKLKGSQPNPKDVIFTDVDNDGDPDVLETWWNGKRVRWLDENDNMKPTDVRGDMS